MVSFQALNDEFIQTHLSAWADEPLSYTHHGGVEKPPQRGFIVDIHRIQLGQGEAVYQQACMDLDRWSMFPPWTRVHRTKTEQKPGALVAMVVQIFGLWWINPCRILTRWDSPSRHGFSYGTLPEHAECGEERFMVERMPDGSVWYEIRAFSRPRHWMTRLAFPVARWWQLRFVRDSQAAMKKLSA